MALLVILACMGTFYSFATDSPSPVKQLELTAVWCTLGLIAVALLSSVNPLLSLPIATAVAAPLWYLTLSASQQQARSEEKDTLNLWRTWQLTTGTHLSDATQHSSNASLSTRLSHFGQGQVVEEIEMTQLPSNSPFDSPSIGNSPFENPHDREQEQLPIALRNLQLAPVESPAYRRRGRM